MPHYTPWLVSLQYVRQHRRLTTAQTDDDTLIGQFIQEASADFIEGLQRLPMPYNDTKLFSNVSVQGLELKLRDDLLAVTSVTDGDGGVVDSGVYNLRPDNRYPKHTIELESSSGTYWLTTYPEDRITLAGTWGYVPQYPSCWRAQTTLAVAIADATTLSFTLTNATGLSVGDYLKIENEVLGYITSIASNIVTVDERGALGTTATSHAITPSLPSVYKFQQLPDIAGAVREIVVYKYLHKDAIGGGVKVMAEGSVTVGDLDPSVDVVLERHRVKLMPKAV